MYSRILCKCKSIFKYNSIFFFFNDTATTEIYTLSLHDALPICRLMQRIRVLLPLPLGPQTTNTLPASIERSMRSEEHTSELQSQFHLVCRLLLEKKNIRITSYCNQPINKFTIHSCITQPLHTLL